MQQRREGLQAEHEGAVHHAREQLLLMGRERVEAVEKAHEEATQTAVGEIKRRFDTEHEVWLSAAQTAHGEERRAIEGQTEASLCQAWAVERARIEEKFKREMAGLVALVRERGEKELMRKQQDISASLQKLSEAPDSELSSVRATLSADMKATEKLSMFATRLHQLSSENKKLKRELSKECPTCRKLFRANSELLVRSHAMSMSRTQAPL
jgi:hypothetical protein